MKKGITVVSLLAIVLSAAAGCGMKPEEEFKQTGTTCGNVVMGAGTFAYANDFIYISDHGNVYEYDLQSGKTVSLVESGDWSQSLFVTEEYIYWADSSKGLQYMSKDGKRQATLFVPQDSKCWYLFADGKELFYLDGIGSNLYCQTLPIPEESGADGGPVILRSHVNQYYIDKDAIYAVILANEEEGELQNYLVCSSRDKVSFEKIDLSFPPVGVFPYEGDLYLSAQETFQIIRRTSTGEETVLPIYSTYYQVLDGQIIYLDSKTFKNSCFTLKSYDLETGAIMDISESVYNFCILEDRYICIQNGANIPGYQYYDRQTGELIPMVREDI